MKRANRLVVREAGICSVERLLHTLGFQPIRWLRRNQRRENCADPLNHHLRAFRKFTR